MTKITENQYWQIYGLIVAKIHLDNQITSLHKSYSVIVGKDAEDRFWDYGDMYDLDKIKDHLKFDKVKIVRKKKQ